MLLQCACVLQNVRYIRDVRAVAKAKGPTVDEVCMLWHRPRRYAIFNM